MDPVSALAPGILVQREAECLHISIVTDGTAILIEKEQVGYADDAVDTRCKGPHVIENHAGCGTLFLATEVYQRQAVFGENGFKRVIDSIVVEICGDEWRKEGKGEEQDECYPFHGASFQEKYSVVSEGRSICPGARSVPVCDRTKWACRVCIGGYSLNHFSIGRWTGTGTFNECSWNLTLGNSTPVR